MKNTRQLWTVAIGRSVSLLGDEVALVALALRLQGGGAPPWQIAALFVAGLLPLVALAGPVGRLVDRADSRTLLVVSSMFQAACCLGLVVTTNDVTVLALVAALGCGEAVNGATWQALVPSIAGLDDIGAAMSVMQTARTAATVAAPAIAGVLVGTFGTRLPLLVDVVSYLAITLTALLVSTRRKAGLRRGDPGARSGWAIVRGDRLLRALLALVATFVTLGASVVVVEVFLIRETLHASAIWYGIALAFWGVGMLGGGVASGRWLRSDRAEVRALLAAVVVLSVSMVGFALCQNIGQLIALSVVGGVANGAVNLAGSTLLTRRAAPEARGRVAAVWSGVLSAALIGAYAVGGIAGAFLSPREIYAIGGVLGLIAPLALGPSLLRALSAGEPVVEVVDQADGARSSQAA